MSELTWDTLHLEHAGAYETLVSHEDYQGNLMPAVQAIQPQAGKVAGKFDCGTGRLSRLLDGSVQALHFQIFLSN